MSSRALPIACLAPAKVNLGLLVGASRADGLHEVVTVMQSITLADRVTLEWAPGGVLADEVLCAGVEGENLALRALRALREELGWRAPPLRLSILKRIPVAAGLGGGSADAAAALRLGALAAGLDDQSLLHRVAIGLGADVPAQVRPGAWLGTGAGEQLERLPDPGPAFGLLVLPLAAALLARDVYACADRLGLGRSAHELEGAHVRLRELLRGGAGVPPGDLLGNDLQQAAIELCPAIEPSLDRARGAGADHVFVSGSGPTVIGLFTGADGPERARAATGAIRGESPAAVWAIPVAAQFGAAVSLGAQQSQSIPPMSELNNR